MPIRIYTSLEELLPCGKSAVALGYFDGLHAGHAAVISRAVAKAEEALCPCVFTFTVKGGHPKAKPQDSEITTESQKRSLLEQWGVRLVLEPDFSEFQQMPPEEFVEEVLLRRMHAAVVCCGTDFRFGHRASAGVDELAVLCRDRKIALEVVPPVTYEGERVSSTRIRALLEDGRVEQANVLLGRPFAYDFPVAHGRQLGRKLDFPTINQAIPREFVKLRRGVYASVTFAQGEFYPSVTNIGIRPTVDEHQPVTSETSIFGFSGDLYGQKVEVRLLKFLRAEKRFPSVQALREQIAADSAAALPIGRSYLDGEANYGRIGTLQSAHTML